MLVAAAWLDAWLVTAQRRAAASFDVWDLYPILTLGTIAVGGACLLVGRLGARAAPLVGVLYALVCGFLAGLEWWIFAFGASADGRPAPIPGPIARLMTDLLLRTTGPLHAVAIIAGAMLVTGLVSLVRWLRSRRAAAPQTVVPDAPSA